MIFNNNKINRKDFLLKSGCAICSLAFSDPILSCIKNNFLYAGTSDSYKRIASHWKPLRDKTVQCVLCPNECVIDDGDRGRCRARENSGGKLYTIVYSRLVSIHIDPVEKKPMNHFMPGAMALSVATAGCNLSCKFCQNWQLSQTKPEDIEAEKTPPEELVQEAISSKSEIIAFTYNEPTVQYEYIVDVSRIAKSKGKKSIIISNGYINPEASRELVKNLDGVKIDFKGFTDKYYRDICGGKLSAVQKNLMTVYSSGKWLETVTLVIPTLNDSPEEIRNMARWVKSNLSADVPMHFTMFHSMYLIKNLPPTPVMTLERCREIAVSEGIRYAYVGNVPGHKWENTYCHNCSKMLIQRSGFFTIANNLKNGTCPYCNTKIPPVSKKLYILSRKRL